MDIPVSDAKARLTDLVRRAEAGEEIVLTRNGLIVARIVAARAPVDRERRADLIARVRKSARRAQSQGLSSARSQDFLYGAEGLPK
ncbi:type II toxin-antitoxin system prevent-host-death family antitoxin [Hyphomonadaceae bacterium ML37]|nr:type II toxin-antitoxin system prevent-host-death family antitoxin [Hyphomonadaceae bacterium ML37]